jgi:hypothetical protein
VVAALIPACRLWDKTSAAGNRYLIGRMGGERVMVMTNTRPEGENDASHVLMFAEAPQYSPSQATPAEPSQAKPVRRRTQHGTEKQQMDDDPVPF